MGRNPGKFDRRILLQTLTTTRGASGGVVESWSDLDTVWAEKIEKGSTEFRTAGAVHAEATRLFRIRHRSDLTEKDRVSFDDRLHDILGLTEEGRGEFLLIACKFTEGRA
jgi:SPP1 family predicted phage head-tail adaptor